MTAVLRRALAKAGLPEDAVALVEDSGHETAVEFMRLRGVIDCLIPRGGPALIASLLEHATVPYVLDGDGNCHVYVDAAADLDMAADDRGQRQDPAARGVQRRRDAARPRRGGRGLPAPGAPRPWPGSSWWATSGRGRVLPDVAPATEEDFATEFLALKMAVAVVDDLGRRHRPHRPLRLGPLRGHRDHRPGGRRPVRRARSTRRRWW